MFEKKEKEYLIYQIKQDFSFDNALSKFTKNGEPYIEQIAYGKSKKDLKVFLETAWDLCNVYCWDSEQADKSEKFRNPITRNNEDFVIPIYENFIGIVNSDIIICDKNENTKFYAADIIGWKKFNTLDDAKNFIIKNSPVFN